MTCEAVLRLLAQGRWDVSDEEVPIYLAAQFGTAQVNAAVKAVAGEFTGEARHAVNTIAYQLGWVERLGRKRDPVN